MSKFKDIINLVHLGKNPYEGFPAAQWAGTWYGDGGAARDIFKRVIDDLNPSIIIEVGSFVGESAIFMARHLKSKGMDSVILCVDTWYAGFDHWKGAREKINMHYGRADLFYKFMGNVIANGCQDVIVPLAMDSIGAAKVIKWLGIVPSLVYCDASHEEGDVLRDMESYWDILPIGGGLLCDDWSNHFPGVLKDGQRFMDKYAVTPSSIEGEKVFFIKS